MKILVLLTDGFGGNSWRLVTTASAKDEIAKGLHFQPLSPDGIALYEAAWSKFTAGG